MRLRCSGSWPCDGTLNWNSYCRLWPLSSFPLLPQLCPTCGQVLYSTAPVTPLLKDVTTPYYHPGSWTCQGKATFKSIRAHGWLSWLSDQLLISVEVVISQFLGSSPATGSALTVQTLFGILSLYLVPACTLKINLKKFF